MSTSIPRLALLLLLVCVTPALHAQEDVLPPGDDSPILRLDVGGPSSYVSGMAFSPDGRKLYAGGWDKLVHVWALDGDRFVYAPRDVVRIPVGAGLDGGISTIALSPDGQWLAVAGRGYARQIAGPRHTGWIWPAAAMSDATRLDRGLIYVYHTSRREVRLLRGHLGPVQTLAFADGPGNAPLLVSAAEENEGEETALIVRAWNVATRQQLGDPLQLGRAGWPPRIVAWQTNAAVHGVRTAIAWESRRKGQNGQPTWSFSIWEPGNRPQTGVPPVVTRSAILLDHRRGRVLTGAHAEIGEWTTPARLIGGVANLQKDRDYSRTVAFAQNLVAEAGTLVSSQANGDMDHAAFVITDYRDKNARRHYLRLLDHGQKKFVGEWTHLWTGEAKVPTVAASPGGRYVAVAGNSKHSIRIFGVRSLLSGEKRPHQDLQGRGSTVDTVSFAKNGNDLGLLLDEKKVFDIVNRTVVDRGNLWTPVTPPGAARWQVRARQTDAGKTFPVTVTTPAGRQRQMQPEDEESRDDEVSATAHCPVVDENLCPVPLLAVATHEAGEPRLVLYNIETGQDVRWLTGHTERIRSLAFSDDGKFLVSAAEDRTVRVWSMTDLLEKTLGKRGLLRGLAVRHDNNRLTVVESSDNALAVGDTVHGIVADDGLREFPAAWEFYHYISRREPGEMLTLKVGAGGGRDVQLNVDQAVDERKPLFSLFLAGDGDADRWQWIGWNPLGPYDVSNRDFETQLGWHFNTGEADAPVRFAHAEEYREQNLRPGLLRDLLDSGGLTAPPPPPEPETSLHFETHDGRLLERDYDNAEHFFSRTSELTAILDISKIGPELIESVDLVVGERKVADLIRRTDEIGTWTADISGLEWSPRLLTFGVRLQTREVRPRSIEPQETESVRFQPSPPDLATDVKNFQEVAEARFPFTATVSRVVASGTVELIHEFDDQAGQRQTKMVAKLPSEPGKELSVNEFLELAPGDNDIRVVARNDNAPKRYQHLEESLLIRTITRKRGKQPAIGGLKLKLGNKVEDVAPLIEVKAEEVFVLAGIDAPQGEKLAEVHLTVHKMPDDPAAEQVVAKIDEFDGFKPGQDANLKFETKVALLPGRQRVVIEAKATDNSMAKTDFVIDYQPEFPQIMHLRLREPEFVKQPPAHVDVSRLKSGRLYSGLHKPQVTVTAELSSALPAGDAAPKFEIIVNDQPQPIDNVSVDRDRRQVSAVVPVSPGESNIQLRLKRDEVTGPFSKAVSVDYWRPPYFESVSAEDKTESTSIPLEAVVISELPLAKQDVEVKVNDGRWRPADVVRLAQVGNGPKWQLAIENVPLESDKTQQAVYVRAANTDGGSVVTGFKQVELALERPMEKLDVAFYEPMGSTNVDTPQLTVTFDVDSSLPIDGVRLLQDGQPVGEGWRDLARGKHRLSQSVSLRPAENQLQVEVIAQRDGATFVQHSEPIILSLQQQPVTVLVELVEAIDGDKVQRLQNMAEGEDIRFNKAAEHNYVTIHGRVKWPNNEKRRAVDTEAWVKSWANCFRHDLGQVKPDGSFQVDVILNRKTGNYVELDLPLPQESSSPSKLFKLDCDNPLERQWLHLLVVDGDAADDQPEVSMEQLGSALRATGPPGAETALPNFEHVERYGPLTGQLADADHIKSQLKRNIAPRLRRKRQLNRRLVNDMVIVFFRGGITVTDDRRPLLLPHDNASLKAGIEYAELGQILEDHVPGAHVFLGDFEGDKVAADQLSEFRRAGLLAVVWPKGRRPAANEGLLAGLQVGVGRAAKFGAVMASVADFVAQRGSQYKENVPEPMYDFLMGHADQPVPPPQ